jgi:hypothetical protein
MPQKYCNRSRIMDPWKLKTQAGRPSLSNTEPSFGPLVHDYARLHCCFYLGADDIHASMALYARQLYTFILQSFCCVTLLFLEVRRSGMTWKSWRKNARAGSKLRKRGEIMHTVGENGTANKKQSWLRQVRLSQWIQHLHIQSKIFLLSGDKFSPAALSLLYLSRVATLDQIKENLPLNSQAWWRFEVTTFLESAFKCACGIDELAWPTEWHTGCMHIQA